eukprot:757480-Hanusia_phi.AAC.6
MVRNLVDAGVDVAACLESMRETAKMQRRTRLPCSLHAADGPVDVEGHQRHARHARLHGCQADGGLQEGQEEGEGAHVPDRGNDPRICEGSAYDRDGTEGGGRGREKEKRRGEEEQGQQE